MLKINTSLIQYLLIIYILFSFRSVIKELKFKGTRELMNY